MAASSCQSLLLAVLLLLWSSLLQLVVGTPSRDVAALQELLQEWQHIVASTEGRPSVALFDNWSLEKDADPCTSRWNGVVCSPIKSVVNLHLNGANLSGGIPTVIGALDELVILDLSGNPRLTSSIPREMGHLRHLTHLKLSDCNLSGKVPQEVYDLSELEYLDLSNNPHLLLHRDAQDIASFRRQRLSSMSHRRALLQVNGRTPLPIFFTYIALACVALVCTIIFVFCLCRWMSVRKTRTDTFLMVPAPPIAATSARSRRIFASEHDGEAEQHP